MDPMMLAVVCCVPAGAACGLGGKIMFDWLKNGRSNGRSKEFQQHCPQHDELVRVTTETNVIVKHVDEDQGVLLGRLEKYSGEVFTRLRTTEGRVGILEDRDKRG